MKTIQVAVLLAILTLRGAGQDTTGSKIKELKISLGTFNTISNNHAVTVSPAISGQLGDYYFENRYNYEAGNSASINVGKRVFKKLTRFEIVPMVGLVFGSFQAVTAELQTSVDYNKWIFSIDNQFSFEYRQPGKSLYFNWTMAVYKLSDRFRIGLTSFLDKHTNKNTIFDKGLTAAIVFPKWGLQVYALNYEKDKRYYWISIRYKLRVRLISQ